MTWEQLAEKFSVLSLRERALVLCAVTTVVLIVGVQLVISPILEQQDKIQKQRLQNTLQLSELTAEETALTVRLSNNPNDRLREDKQALESQLTALRDNLTNTVATLLSPRETQTLLSSLLADHHGLSLVSARNLPPAVIEVNAHEIEEAADEIRAKVFEHEFEITLSGSYFEARDYLKRLEGLQGFYWRRIQYEVEEYPRAKIVLGITTLSIDEAWIGG